MARDVGSSPQQVHVDSNRRKRNFGSGNLKGRNMRKTFKMGGFTWEVHFQPSDGESFGTTSVQKKAIFIDNTHPMQIQRETLLHELLHACFEDCAPIRVEYVNPGDREEDIVRYLSPRLFQALGENAWLRKFIFGGK